LSYPPHVSQAADVYAFGILAWCVISGEKPFASMESAASLPSAIDQGERPALADGRDWRELTTGNVAKLVEACWVGRYQDRPEFGRPETGVVATLEKLETALAKSTDEEAQIDLINRLIAVESEEHNSVKYVKEIDEALSEAKAEQPDGGDGELLMATQVPIATLVTASEKKELEEEKKGAVVNVEVVRQNARRARDQIQKVPGGNEMLEDVMAMMTEMKANMLKLSQEVASHDHSLSSLANGELECPRLLVILPLEAPSSKVKRMLHRTKSFVSNRFRLVFLDPVSGAAVPTGPDGNGYQVELPSKWLVEHSRVLADGMKVAKIAASLGRVCGLPLPYLSGMPKEVVSQTELEAIKSFESIAGEIGTARPEVVKSTKQAKAVTGKSYRALRHLLDQQCKDKELMHCGMKKYRAKDGTIEWTTAESAEKFIAEGRACLIWNVLEAQQEEKLAAQVCEAGLRA